MVTSLHCMCEWKNIFKREGKKKQQTKKINQGLDGKGEDAYENKKVRDLLDVRSFEVIILMFVITSLKCMHVYADIYTGTCSVH